MSLPDLITRFTRPLTRLGLEYMVTGGVASILYGEPRLTQDLDLVLHLEPGQGAALADAFAGGGFYVSPAETLETEAARPAGGHFNLLDEATGFRADVYLRGSDPLLVWGLAHRRWIPFQADRLAIAPPEYVITAKLRHVRQGGSARHLEDIRAMLRVSGEDIDHSVLLGLIQQFGLTEEWELVAS